MPALKMEPEYEYEYEYDISKKSVITYMLFSSMHQIQYNSEDRFYFLSVLNGTILS